MKERPLIKKAIKYNGGVKFLAKRVGCSPQTIYRWLKCQRNPSPQSAQALALAADGQVSPEDFLAELLAYPRRQA